MPAYVIVVCTKNKDVTQMANYIDLAKQCPVKNFELVAIKGKFEVLEGEPAESVIIMRFPSMADASDWYNSDAYQKALPYRLAAGDYQTYLIEGVS